MTNGIDKKALFKLASEPYLKPISDLGFGFYNLDENTAILRFQFSNDKGPLLISKNNLTAYAYFESTNGSVSDVIELEIEDEFQGIVTITLDSAFLHACTNTTVTGQVYIGVNNVDGNPQYNEVAVLNEFQFEVADALINKISSTTKIEYIRMFSQLKQRVEEQVKAIEDAIANGADYVAEMKTVLKQGKDALNKIVSDGKEDIQTAITKADTDLTKVRSDATEDIITTANNAKSSLQDTASTTINSINTTATEATEHVDAKVTEFNETVETNGFLTPEMLTEETNALAWQKYKLTNDDGTLKTLNVNNKIDELHALKPGQYYLSGTPSLPDNLSQIGIANVSHRQDGNIKCITYIPYNTNVQLIKRLNGTWSNWEYLNQKQTDTGWVPFTIINGGRTNTAYGYGGSRNGYGCSYRVVTTGNKIEKHVRVNADSIVDGQVITQLPNNFTSSPQIAFVRAPKDHNGTSIILENTGELKVYVANVTQWTATSDKYIYGNMYWVE